MLGGTTEASRLARHLADRGIDAVFSYAGRTARPVPQPLPTRTGGFGGVDGLIDYLAREGISHVIDATHPFAAGMSRNAILACARAKVPLLGYERKPWQAQDGDRWTHVPDMDAACCSLPEHDARVFLAIGKQQLAGFAAKPRNHYLLRLVDPPEGVLPLPETEVVIARGPFDAEGDLDLMRRHRITHVVAKNAGGAGAEAKLIAARRLGLPVIMVDRPVLPPRELCDSLGGVVEWLERHHAVPAATVPRGV
ncbi:precorrin-6A reductase [Celeribacter neptunius]|uniref:Precorrin-6A reductase n=1 Tax=Celeribacter neptunius TaxID=588602 RepID=A0A1I3PQP6_9RHOB|nr:precorrin-6A reductase [Celeribacter neptunius]